MRIIRNSGVCRRCGDELVSSKQSTAVWCTCGAVAIDGGYVTLSRTSGSYTDSVGDVFLDTSMVL